MPRKKAYTQEDMYDAQFAITDEGYSLSAAAQKFGVPKRRSGPSCTAQPDRPQNSFSQHSA